MNHFKLQSRTKTFKSLFKQTYAHFPNGPWKHLANLTMSKLFNVTYFQFSQLKQCAGIEALQKPLKGNWSNPICDQFAVLPNIEVEKDVYSVDKMFFTRRPITCGRRISKDLAFTLQLTWEPWYSLVRLDQVLEYMKSVDGYFSSVICYTQFGTDNKLLMIVVPSRCNSSKSWDSTFSLENLNLALVKC